MISVKDVSHTYMTGTPFEKVALKNISFDAAQGEVLAIAGHTGSGKSTLIQIVAGLIDLQSGTVEIDGLPVSEKKFAAWSASSSNIPNISFSRRRSSTILPLHRGISA